MKRKNILESLLVICLLLVPLVYAGAATKLNDVENNEIDILNVDNEPPVTSIYCDGVPYMITLVAVDYGNPPSGVKATYYGIDGGDIQIYTEPFFIDEGTNTMEYWSEDNAGNVETCNTVTFTHDSTPPTIELTSPEEGKLYWFGIPLMSRIPDYKTLCIGNFPVVANADDGTGSGVCMVLFSFSNGDSGFDDNGTNGFTYTFKGMHFGELTITAVAIDNAGLTSTSDSMTVDVYSLGLI
jgi:hypothetical protein